MLRKIRIVLALTFLVGVTLLFLDYTGMAHQWLGWMARVQFLPALLSLNVVVVLALIAVTLIFGRVYCSVVCPLGVMQDIFSWLSGRRKRKKYRFSYSPAKKWLRYGVLALFLVAMAVGVGSFVALLAPYSAYGRIAQNLLSPLWLWCNNLLAHYAERIGAYEVYEKEVCIRSAATFAIAVATVVALFTLAWRNGRTYCNAICPVGTILGTLARFSWFKPVIDTDKCVGCGLCARACKASCIDSKAHKIDYSRCVACMDCIDHCHSGAIKYSYRRRSKSVHSPYSDANQSASLSVDDGRRNFLSATLLLAATLIADAKKKTVGRGVAKITDTKRPERRTPITPPGSVGHWHISRHCTGCQLCVSACPHNVLRPSTRLETLMQPECTYERGYCDPDCTRCSQVCPTGAIHPITPEEKADIQIGHAVWVEQNCLVMTVGAKCGRCAYNCPNGAIVMLPIDENDENSRRVPVVDTERCIGCGACEYVCPARPFKAIYVEGYEEHREI